MSAKPFEKILRIDVEDGTPRWNYFPARFDMEHRGKLRPAAHLGNGSETVMRPDETAAASGMSLPSTDELISNLDEQL